MGSNVRNVNQSATAVMAGTGVGISYNQAVGRISVSGGSDWEGWDEWVDPDVELVCAADSVEVCEACD